MDIPLWILLVPLAFIVAFTVLFLFFNVFHLVRYGVVGRGAVALTLVYIVSYLFVLVLGATALLDIPWTETVTLHDILPFTGGSSSSFGL
jgi:flagellar biosynthesis protein FlhB